MGSQEIGCICNSDMAESGPLWVNRVRNAWERIFILSKRVARRADHRRDSLANYSSGFFGNSADRVNFLYLRKSSLVVYFIVISPVVKFIKTNSRNFRLVLVNRGGLPPFTGFLIKLNAVKAVSAKMGALIIMGRGVALMSYTRMLLNFGFEKDKLTGLVLLALIAGIV